MTKQGPSVDWARLRTLLKAYVAPAVEFLATLRELPRPQWTPLDLIDDRLLTYHFDAMTSYRALQDYIRESGLQDGLHSFGHTWFWTREVFTELFLELLVRASKGSIPTDQDFERLFRITQTELTRPFTHLRLLANVYGFPASNREIRLARGTRIAPIDINSGAAELYRLLGIEWQRHDTERYSHGGHLLCIDRLVGRSGDGRQAMAAVEAMQQAAQDVLLAGRIAWRGSPVIGNTYLCQVSRFPLFPLIHWPNADLRGGFVANLSEWTPAHSRRLMRPLRLLHSGRRETQPRLGTVLARFHGAYRFMDHSSNIIDLLVALESMLGPSSEELRRRLSLRAALLLGTTDADRQRVYKLVSTAYEIRNTLVHGQENPRKKLQKAIAAYAPWLGKSANSGDIDSLLRRVTTDLRETTRLCVLGFLECQFAHGKWPETEEDWDGASFSRKARRELRKRARIPAR